MTNNQQLSETIEQIKLNLDLNYDEKSVGILENQIDWMSEQNVEYDIQKAINDYSLFYGQCLVNVYGGIWIIDPSTHKQLVSLQHFLTIDPIEVIKAYYNKRHYNTSFYLFFKGLSRILPVKLLLK